MAKFEGPIALIHACLQRLVGYHRQLLEVVRMEKDALIQADLKSIQESTCAKQVLIESIRLEEGQRLRYLGDLALEWKRPVRELTLAEIGITIQGLDPKGADQLRTAFNALTILIKRVSDQNNENKTLVERSLLHISEMKKNVLGEVTEKSGTYTHKGAKTTGSGASRLISREA